MKKSIKNSILVGAAILMSCSIACADTWTHPSYATSSVLKDGNVQHYLTNTTRSEKNDNRSWLNQNMQQGTKNHLKAQENVRFHSIYNSNH